MPKVFDVGAEAVGVIAIGQSATGVIAIGQTALGVVAIGQLARGFVTVGQLSIGVASLGQLAIAPGFSVGMVGVGGLFGGGGLLVPSLALHTHDSATSKVVKIGVAIALVAVLIVIAALPLWRGLFPAPAAPPRVLR